MIGRSILVNYTGHHGSMMAQGRINQFCLHLEYSHPDKPLHICDIDQCILIEVQLERIGEGERDFIFKRRSII